MTLEEAAKEMYNWLNRPIHRGMVGVGSGKIIVYMHQGRGQTFDGVVPCDWAGYEIEWNWNVGRPKALSA